MKRALSVLAAVFFLIMSGVAEAERADDRPAQGLGKWLEEVGIAGAYTHGGLKGGLDFGSASIGVRFGFDLKPFVKKFGLQPPGLLEIVYEPTAGTITQPLYNIEVMLPVSLRYAYPLMEKLYPYVEIGTGPYYFTLHTYEQSTQINFMSIGGAGFLYFLRDDLAVTVGYRRRHISNGSVKEPNGGIDANAVTFGVSWFF
ncbi:MAG: acyloxyacyl hydrolase [Deltaproteobacteria bacterium]